LLNSPSPFLIGDVLTGALRTFPFVDTALLVQIDTKRVGLSGAEFPQFPRLAQVTAGIRSLLGHHRNREGGNPFGHTVSCGEGMTW
jgi:hypothetical protein